MTFFFNVNITEYNIYIYTYFDDDDIDDDVCVINNI